jgi:hypothetical protein
MGLLELFPNVSDPSITQALPSLPRPQPQTVSNNYSQPTKGLFHKPFELKVYQRMVAEAYRVAYPSIPLFLIDRVRTSVDTLLLEAPKKTWKKPIFIPGQITWSPTDAPLTQFGMEPDQEVLVIFPEFCLRDAGILDLSDMKGGVVILTTNKDNNFREYEILSVHVQPQDAWGFAGDSFNVALTVNFRSQTGLSSVRDLASYHPR